MFLARSAEKVCAMRSVSDDRLARVLLAVQQTQRIMLQSPLAVVTKSVKLRSVIVLQRLNILRAALSVPNRIDAQRQLFEANGFQESPSNLDDFGVDGCVAIAVDLDAKLVMLTIPASLRTLVPKNRTDVIQAHWLR